MVIENIKNQKSVSLPYLFVYGTLMRESLSKIDPILVKHTTFITRAKAQGQLYLIERADGSFNYPGLILSDHQDHIVHGELFRVGNAKRLFEILNQYEECSPTCPKPHEYRRGIIAVKRPDQTTLKAVTYIYNRAVENLQLIESGSFHEI